MRTLYCGQLNENHDKQQVSLCGWVHRRRDLGGLIFIDLRDREGLVQVVFEPDSPVFDTANSLRNEFCLRLTGTVRRRPDSQVRTDMATGAVEVVASELEILNSAAPLPLQLSEHENTSEEQRLRYRYLDLRRPDMNQRLQFRAKVTGAVRRFLEEQGFVDVETPILTRATPEGARDYLVPSRTHKGQFFALPQSPQLFKQLLMMSGLDRYYQIAKCFRDEDLRADRQPEFTQIDIETSFMTADQVMEVTEAMVRTLFRDLLDVELGEFPRMTWHEAMARYGSDKPDLRIPLELVDVDDLVKDVEFKVFSGPANDANGRVAALRIPGGASLSRKQIDDYGKFAAVYGAKGLAWLKVNDRAAGRDGLQSPVLKFLSDAILPELLARTGADNGDIVLFGADRAMVVAESMGALRLKAGADFNLVEEGWRPMWLVDFPMFEEGEARPTALHHPFTSPLDVTPEQLEADPYNALSNAYDMVLNGVELGGGSVRIHDKEMQQAVFRVLGIDEQEANEKFGFLLEALQYGAPPHAGLAFGLDRMVMLMCGAESIRDVMAFPKTTTAACPLTDAPGSAAGEHLGELGLQLLQPSDAKPVE